MTATETCKNCGHQFVGKFCNNCGEKVYKENDKSIKHFFGEAFHFISHLDNKFFKTLHTIFSRPGQFSLDYTNGIRNRYYKPVSLFLIGVVLYLIFPLFQGLNMSFWGTLTNQKAISLGFVNDLAINKAAAKHITMDELAVRYDHKSPAFAKVLLLLLLPLTGIALQAMFKKRKRYFFDHMMLATEACCFYLYFTFFILPITLWLIEQPMRWLHLNAHIILTDLITLPLSFLIIVLWAARAFRTFYGTPKTRSFFKGLLFLFLHSFIIFIIYRLILFLTVLLFI